MKKLLVVGLLIFGITVGAFAVYADAADTNEFSLTRGFGHMMGRGFNRGMDLTSEEKDELIKNRSEFFEKLDNLTDEERQEWISKMQEEKSEYREEMIKKGLENGSITEEQAGEWRTHFVEMDKFHEENGFIAGGCHGGRIGRGQGRRNGMMGGNRF